MKECETKLEEIVQMDEVARQGARAPEKQRKSFRKE